MDDAGEKKDTEAPKDNSEDVEIDFSKILGIFGKKKTAESEKTHETAEHEQHTSHESHETTHHEAKMHSHDGSSVQHHSAHHEAKHSTEEKSDDEIDLGSALKSIKGIFKGGSGVKDEDSIDTAAITTFVAKHHLTILMILGILVSVWLGMSIRLHSGELGFTDGWAGSSIDTTIRNDISGFLQQQYSNLPDKNKQAVIAEEMSKAYSSGTYTFKTAPYAGQTINIKQQLDLTSSQFKQFFQDEQGRNYMPDIDPYYWLRYAENIVNTGHVGDEAKNGLQWDNHQFAPIGRPIGAQDTFYPASIAVFYKIAKPVASMLGKDASLERIIMFYPVFIMVLATLIVFLITRKVAGNMAAFFAASMVTVHGALLSRTLFGHADSDALTVLLAVLVLWLFIEAFTASKLKWKVLFASLAGLSTGIYGIAWGGWWWIFDFVLIASIGTVGVYILYEAARQVIKGENTAAKALISAIKEKVTRKGLTTIIIYFISAGIFVSLFTGFANFWQTPLVSIGFSAIKTPVLDTSMPNVLRTVAELNEGSLQQGFEQIGGSAPIPGTLMWIAITGIALIGITALVNGARKLEKRSLQNGIVYGGTLAINLIIIAVSIMLYGGRLWFPLIMLVAPVTFFIAYLALKYKEEVSYEELLKSVFYVAVLSIWLAATLYAVTKGIRFTLLIVPAFSIAFGTFFGMSASYIILWLKKEVKLSKMMALAAMAVLFVAFMFVFPGATFNGGVVQSSKNIARNDVPLINDAWHNALTTIKDNSNKTAIITSWWDFGHHFKQIADRPVTFDGTTQGSPQAHWVGRLLSTDNEHEAIGILRMLDCGAQTGTDTLREILGDNVEAVLLTKRIILLEKEDARQALLEEGLTEEQAAGVLEKTHCDPPEAFVIASEDMIGKSGVWGHFGAWNFTKADIWKATKQMSRAQAVDYIKSKFAIAEDEANSLFDQVQTINDDRAADAWIGPWVGFSGGTNGCGASGGKAVCSDGLVVNLTDYDAYYPTSTGNLHPQSIAYPTPDGGVAEKKFTNNTIPQDLSVLFVPSGDSYFSVLASPQLIDGMFARMFYMQGQGLTHFKLLTRQRGFTGTDIYVWQVDWEGNQKNILNELKVKAEVANGDSVTLNYIGYEENGLIFDSSINDYQSREITPETHLDSSFEYNPFTLTIGAGQVIPGFEKGLIGAKLGEERIITIPPEDGYNQPGHPLYNMTLYFRVKIEKIK